MVLNIEYNVSPFSVPTALINMSRLPVGYVYIYLTCSHSLLYAGSLNHPGAQNLAQYIVSVKIFVVEANDQDVRLDDDHVSRVLMQPYAAATKLKYGSHLHLPILQS